MEKDLDPSVGRLEFTRFVWGVGEDGKYFIDPYEIKSHPCTREELGLDNQKGQSSSNFMPIHKLSSGALEQFAGKFMCMDIEQLTIAGSYSSDKGSLIKASLHRC